MISRFDELGDFNDLIEVFLLPKPFWLGFSFIFYPFFSTFILITLSFFPFKLFTIYNFYSFISGFLTFLYWMLVNEVLFFVKALDGLGWFFIYYFYSYLSGGFMISLGILTGFGALGTFGSPRRIPRLHFYTFSCVSMIEGFIWIKSAS